MPTEQLAIGLMSGTSLDGADAVLARFSDAGPPVLLGHCHAPFEAPLRDALMALQRPGEDELHRAALAANALADHYGKLVERLLTESGIERGAVHAIGAHGQTVRHRPELGYTVQLNAPARLAEATSIPVVADFRSGDVAAGGHGAPLVPAFHAAVFGDEARWRAVLNLGGIANLTELPPAQSGLPVRGWDCGPGNVLLDGWAARHARGNFDAAGAWAGSGAVHAGLLAELASEPWLLGVPPKSTGRDLFNAEWLASRLVDFAQLAPADVQSTLAQFTAQCVAASVAGNMGAIEELVVCGGGVKNADLLERLDRALADHLGRVPRDLGGALLAFAWLALRRLAGEAGNLPAVTGARGPRLLGAEYRKTGSPP